MHFSESDIQRFAEWSGDCNPLHVDREFARGTSFKQPIAHGMLSVLGALGSVKSRSADPLRALEIEFRGAVFPDGVYDLESVRGPGELTIAVGREDQTVLSLRGEIGPPAPAPSTGEAAWLTALKSSPAHELAHSRPRPADRDLDELRQGLEIRSRYETEPPAAAWVSNGLLTPSQARVLGLCSYLVGMEVPGLRSLFTRLSLTFFAGPADSPELWYRARTTRFDPQFRILDTALEVAAADGTLIAAADVRSYVRFTPLVLDLDALAAMLPPAAQRLSGRVALVCGGSRGLGADLTSALALAGCRVYASYHGGAEAARDLSERLAERNLAVELLHGDAGDPDWCRKTLETLRARQGRLDLLVLNACAPPSVLQIGPETAARFGEYVTENLQLATVPLAASLSLLAESQGTVVGISSSFVTDPQPGFGHYIALKQAVEGALRTVTREFAQVRSLIVRPPRLQTSWNDTPTGVLGTIPTSWVAVQMVARLADEGAPGHVELLTEFPAPAVVPAEEDQSEPAEAQFTVALSASFTAEPLVPAFRFWFRELGIAGRVEVAPYGQVLQELLNPASGLSTNSRGANVVLLRIRDWLRELPDDRARAGDFARQYLAETAQEFERAVRAHRAQARTETVVVLCPSVISPASELDRALAETEDQVQNALRGVPGLQVLAAEEFHELYGVSAAQIDDPLRDKLAHVPYQDSYLCTLATIVMRRVQRRLGGPKKVVVVDCDNTLWKGVVGEVGAEGIEIDEQHRLLHQALDRLSRSGVLVCLCSKNEESDVWRVFETRDDLGLRREQIVAAMINWQPKSENVRRLASRLNLGLDSFIFVDDNPVECAEVAAACPEVLTLNWPLDPDRARRLLDHTWELDSTEGTREDQQRTRLYQEEFQRQALQEQTLTFRDFLDRLDLVVDVAPLASEDLRRAAQLTHRTNQFNFTTRRREETDLQALLAQGGHDVLTVRVRDRFGDYGLVGLVITDLVDDLLEVDTFLLSCRVLGRGVEHRMAAELGRLARERGLRAVKMRVERTKRNAPARSFLESICPPELRHASDELLECELAAESLAALRFEPAESAPAPVEEKAESRAPALATSVAGPRQREQQIVRAAYELARAAELHGAIEGRPAAPTPAVVAEDDLATAVYEVFARALKLPADEVRRVDRLEALGCGSFKIVEITVELVARFPWIPSTLLFEHRSVAEIVHSIAELSRPKEMKIEASAASSAGAAQSPEPEVARSLDIAVVGIGVRCAGADSADGLWELLSSGGSSVRPVPAERPYFLGRLFDDRPHFAGLLDRLDEFDPEFFGISPRETELMDPQLRLFLKVAWEALEDAGCVGMRQEPETGVFAGVMYGDYAYRANIVARQSENPFKCWEGFSLANRLSQILGFHGPSVAVDTACSSSGTALHLACQALRAGECSSAVVGGVNLILDPDRFIQLGRLGILSLSGNCRPFGAEADGTVLGEGAGVVVLRPLAEALARGDRIYGVIKGTGLSTGSGTVGFTAPNPQAQAEAIRRAVKSARVDPRTIGYVETHGTGTSLGDPIEVRGLSLAYEDRELWGARTKGDHRCRLGAIKPNVGHLEAGAGVIGLIKVLLQLHHGTLVPSITSTDPNPQIAFRDSPFSVQRQLEPWNRSVLEIDGKPEEVPRRAAVSSFGVGGANAHVIVEEAPPAAPVEATGLERPAHILTISARHDESLRELAQRFRDHLESHPDIEVADACHTANVSRRHFEHRAALPAGRREELLASLGQFLAGDEAPGCACGLVLPSKARPKIAFLFTGQGAQSAGMGRTFFETQPVFREALERCATILDPLLERPLYEVLFAAEGSPAAALLDQTGFTQPALFALEYALARLWQSWGIHPDVVLGHSVGEIAALCIAGGVSLEDGAKLIAARGRLMQALPPGGGMTSVMAGEASVLEAIAGYEDRVSIAAINGPEHIVITGDSQAVAEITARFRSEGIKTKSLTVSHAFHSPLMDPMLEEYAAIVREIRFQKPQVALVSGVRGDLATDELLDSEYWIRQVRDPVRFSDGMAALQRRGVTTFVEIGPHPVLLGMGRSCLETIDDREWLPSLRRDADAWPTILQSLARLYVSGAHIDWRGFDAPYRRQKVSLPPYAFRHERFWIEAPTEQAASIPAPAAPVESAPAAHQHDLYRVVWRKQPRPENGKPHTDAGRWLILADREGTGRALADLLAQNGGSATLVYAGQSYLKSADGSYEIDPAAADDFSRLWRELSESGPVRGVVHLWSLGAAATQGLTVESLEAARRLSVGSAVHLVQKLAEPGKNAPPALWFVTRVAVALENASAEPIAVAQAPLWGLGRTLSLEHPDLWGGMIDLGPTESGGDLKAVLHELLASDGEDQLAFRECARYVPRLTPLRIDSQPELSIAPEGTYLVTGGLGALGLRVARWLVSKGARRLVLTGRRGLNTAGAEEALNELTSSGAFVEVVTADVSSADDVERLFARLAGGSAPLRGVVHAAGIDSVTPLAKVTPDELSSVLAPKVAGGWLLHERTRSLKLDFFLCFSSISAVLGSAGRAPYGAANAFLDALAHERRRLGLPALSVDWGPWRGGGMASDEGLILLERIGNNGLDPDTALRSLETLLATGEVQAMVADVDWERFRIAYESRRPRPLLAEIGQTAPTPPAKSVSDKASPAQAAASQPQTAAEMEALVRTLVAQTLGIKNPSDVRSDKTFYEMGLDSLLAAEFSSKLHKKLGIRNRALVFDYPYVESLAAHLHASLAKPDAVVSGAPAAVPAEAASSRPTESVAASAAAPKSSITGYEPGIEQEVFEFQQLAWPNRQRELLQPRWQWMYVESARRLGLEPRVWLYRDAGRIVGHNGAIPVRLKVGSQVLTTAWFVETMVLEEYRSQAVGSRLMLQAREDLPFSISLGQTEQMREIILKLGWYEVAPLQTAQLLVRPETVLKGKLSSPAALAAGSFLRASTAVRTMLQARPRFDVQQVARFETRHDELWEESARDIACGAVRDASYLNWKYVDQPGQDFLRLEIFERDALRGVVVLMFRDADESYQYRRAFIVEVVAPQSDGRLLKQLVHVAGEAAAERGADAVLCLHVSRALTRALRQAGFMMREPGRFLVVNPGDLPDESRRELLTADGWFVTQGDSDIDRP